VPFRLSLVNRQRGTAVARQDCPPFLGEHLLRFRTEQWQAG
jgi:hypothetical protein